jgi:hypothetical protein
MRQSNSPWQTLKIMVFANRVPCFASITEQIKIKKRLQPECCAVQMVGED